MSCTISGMRHLAHADWKKWKAGEYPGVIKAGKPKKITDSERRDRGRKWDIECPYTDPSREKKMREFLHAITPLYARVTKRTRAGKKGKSIMCPVCSKVVLVFHFVWGDAMCPNCGTIVAKTDWFVHVNDPWGVVSATTTSSL